MTAARKALAYLQAGRDPQASRDPRTLIDAARRLVFLKGNDAHDYKFSSAMLEDCDNASPGSRDRYLASSLLLCRVGGPRQRPCEAYACGPGGVKRQLFVARTLACRVQGLPSPAEDRLEELPDRLPGLYR